MEHGPLRDAYLASHDAHYNTNAQVSSPARASTNPLETPAERIRWAFEKKGLTQSAAAASLRIARPTLYRWLRDGGHNIREDDLSRIALLIEEDPAWLRYGERQRSGSAAGSDDFKRLPADRKRRLQASLLFAEASVSLRRRAYGPEAIAFFKLELRRWIAEGWEPIVIQVAKEEAVSPQRWPAWAGRHGTEFPVETQIRIIAAALDSVKELEEGTLGPPAAAEPVDSQPATLLYRERSREHRVTLHRLPDGSFDVDCSCEEFWKRRTCWRSSAALSLAHRSRLCERAIERWGAEIAKAGQYPLFKLERLLVEVEPLRVTGAVAGHRWSVDYLQHFDEQYQCVVTWDEPEGTCSCGDPECLYLAGALLVFREILDAKATLRKRL
jgi:transcriptional regulator with XRE-family HTH domain